mmetsp:Transcript_13284/g.23820  ORF Transcript_13284/g.23820 Transcript_13284/m.23820 type:complete len:166 (+) Transcript_13284:1801-2298(+)
MRRGSLHPQRASQAVGASHPQTSLPGVDLLTPQARRTGSGRGTFRCSSPSLQPLGSPSSSWCSSAWRTRACVAPACFACAPPGRGQCLLTPTACAPPLCQQHMEPLEQAAFAELSGIQDSVSDAESDTEVVVVPEDAAPAAEAQPPLQPPKAQTQRTIKSFFVVQ